MRTASVGQRAMALSLAFILVSCSAALPSVAGPTGSRDLAKYALIIKSLPDGRATHEWVPLSQFDVTKYTYRASLNPRLEGPIVRVGALDAYCAGRQDQCIEQCKGAIGPIEVEGEEFPYPPDKWWSWGKNWCQGVCTKNYEQCLRRMGRWYAERPTNFVKIDNAIDWLKEHRTEILVGTVVVVAGVALVAVAAASAAGAALVLVPLAVIASGTPPSGEVSPTRVAEVQRGEG